MVQKMTIPIEIIGKTSTKFHTCHIGIIGKDYNS